MADHINYFQGNYNEYGVPQNPQWVVGDESFDFTQIDRVRPQTDGEGFNAFMTADAYVLEFETPEGNTERRLINRDETSDEMVDYLYQQYSGE